jgi:hypothetical protein
VGLVAGDRAVPGLPAEGTKLEDSLLLAAGLRGKRCSTPAGVLRAAWTAMPWYCLKSCGLLHTSKASGHADVLEIAQVVADADVIEQAAQAA